MTPELRVVTKGFSGKHFGAEPSTSNVFRKGDRLIYYENDGAHATFVFESDKSKKEPFIAQVDEFEASTELGSSPR